MRMNKNKCRKRNCKNRKFINPQQLFAVANFKTAPKISRLNSVPTPSDKPAIEPTQDSTNAAKPAPPSHSGR